MSAVLGGVMDISDFVSTKDRLPSEGQEVEAFRVFGLVGNEFHHAYGCTCGVERTTFMRSWFVCDMLSTGITTHWKPATPWPVAAKEDYAGLMEEPHNA